MPGAHDNDIVLAVEGGHKAFGSHRVLHDVNLRIAQGQIVALVGPSGCGKSTLLRIILGILDATSGAAVITGEDGSRRAVDGPGPDRGIVFQTYGLMPFLTARKNAALGPDLIRSTLLGRLVGMINPWSQWRRTRKDDLDQARSSLTGMGLGDALERYPSELSGGMRQRVAISQALLTRPRILLLDEPFGALDEATRESLQEMLLGFYQENMAAAERGEPPPYTILIVTHELNEAIYVSDRVVGLSQYWDWAADGHESCPGATIVYDKAAPIYHPDDIKEYERFIEQRAEIRRVVFEQSYQPPRSEHVGFWQEVADNGGLGVLS